jgi:DNA invertase Pin-like site-specific DNA recombinase
MKPPVTIYGYGRASTDRQAITRQIQEADVRRAVDAYSLLGRFSEGSRYAGFFYDEDTTSRIPFFSRPKGEEINRLLNTGDFIIVAKFDRIFRSVVDLCNTLESFTARGVSLIMLDANLDTSNFMNVGILQLLGVVKWMEREASRSRTKEALQYIKSSGRSLAQPPVGWKTVRYKVPGLAKQFARLEPDYERRRIIERVVRLHDEGSMSFDNIGLLFAREGHKNKRTGRPYHTHYFSDGYAAAKAGYPIYGQHIEPAPIPLGATRIVIPEAIKLALKDIADE